MPGPLRIMGQNKEILISKRHHNQVQGKLMKWEKVFAKHVSNGGLISKYIRNAETQ